MLGLMLPIMAMRAMGRQQQQQQASGQQGVPWIFGGNMPFAADRLAANAAQCAEARKVAKERYERLSTFRRKVGKGKFRAIWMTGIAVWLGALVAIVVEFAAIGHAAVSHVNASDAAAGLTSTYPATVTYQGKTYDCSQVASKPQFKANPYTGAPMNGTNLGGQGYSQPVYNYPVPVWDRCMYAPAGPGQGVSGENINGGFGGGNTGGTATPSGVTPVVPSSGGTGGTGGL